MKKSFQFYTVFSLFISAILFCSGCENSSDETSAEGVTISGTITDPSVSSWSDSDFTNYSGIYAKAVYEYGSDLIDVSSKGISVLTVPFPLLSKTLIRINLWN